MTVTQSYRQALASGRARPDEGQALLVEKLDLLATRLAEREDKRRRGWFSAPRRGSSGADLRGLYIHGPVGREIGRAHV